jgi:predicted amidohydrolase
MAAVTEDSAPDDIGRPRARGPALGGATLRIAAVQAAAIAGEVAANAATVARLTREAAEGGARLAVFPELFLPAYAMKTLAADLGPDVIPGEDGAVDDSRLDPLLDAARDTGVAVLVGASVRRGDRRTISLLLVEGSGPIRAVYDKQHLWADAEQSIFVPGTSATTISVDGWELALGICYDGCFPEHGRAAALDGADGYLCPSAYLAGSEHRRDLYYAARALENTMYVLFTNVVGSADGDDFNGGAAIYAPDGRAVVRADDESEAVIVADLDRAELESVRRTHRMLDDRPDHLPTDRTRVDLAR